MNIAISMETMIIPVVPIALAAGASFGGGGFFRLAKRSRSVERKIASL